MSEKLIESVIVETENGKRLRVNVYQDFSKFEPLNGPSQTMPGSKRARLDDGSPVNIVDDNTFKLVLTDELVRKV